MTTAKFLLRFDDLCPTTNWSTWDPVERLVRDAGVRPLVAVVPHNTDPKLVAGDEDPAFWDRVRSWQDLGWTLAIHGCHHRYQSKDKGLVGLRAKSEFAGVDRATQAELLDRGMERFAQEGIEITTWIAPGHTFDQTTVDLLKERGVRTISDGMWLRPHTADDVFWIPCQTWNFSPRRAGVWTVCLHTNSWTQSDVDGLARSLQEYGPQLTDVEQVRAEFAGRRLAPADRLYETYRRARARG